MTFQMWDLQDIGLAQWNTHGDHPDVVPLIDPQYKLGRICKLCGKPYTEHGLIKNDQYPIHTKYDHFHGRDAITVCPGDYVYKTTNDRNINQSLVIPEKMMHRISDSIITSYKQTIIDKAITEVTYREYYSKDFKLNSDKLVVTNTEFKHETDIHEVLVEISFTMECPDYKLATVTYTHNTDDYKLKSKGDITLDAVGIVNVVKDLSVGVNFNYRGSEFTDILDALKDEVIAKQIEGDDAVVKKIDDITTKQSESNEDLIKRIDELTSRVDELEKAATGP